MVVHTPTKLEALRQTAAERRAANDGSVPPSVAAAAAAATAETASGTPVVDEDGTQVGGVPPSIEVEAEVHEREQEHIHSNVTTRRDRKYTAAGGLTADPNAAEEDKISLAGSISDVTPPPNLGQPPQLNPFTPEWFAQLVGTAASAAASAAVQAMSTSSGQAPGSAAAAPPPAAVPRRLNERKIPDFWEDRPEFWFRIFDAHLAHFSPSERRCFDTLLPLLTPAARATVHSLISSPVDSPYTKAREALLRHFGRTPRQLARELRDTRSLGDKLPSELLDHLESLLPDVKVMFEVVLLDSLPVNARIAALQHSDVRSMARAADQVILESRAAAELGAPLGVTSAVSAIALDDDLAAVSAVSRPPRSTPRQRPDDLCYVHHRYGKEAYKCLAPTTCKMHNVTRPRPATSSVSGNGKAGGRQ